jgi:hypothetical protein
MAEPTGTYSITMPRDIAEADRARSGPSGLSAYVAAAVARQVERDDLNEVIRVAEAEHGPVSDDEVQSLRDQLDQAREQQTQGRTTQRDPLLRRSGRHRGPRRRGAGRSRPERPHSDRLARPGPRRRPARDHLGCHAGGGGPPPDQPPGAGVDPRRTGHEPIDRHAAALLAGAGRHGHTYAVGAMLGATALAAPGPSPQPCAAGASQ